MLNKILEYEKQALNDKIHMGINVGIAVEDYDTIKLRFAKINADLKNDLTDSFNFAKDRFMINPGIYPEKPVKKIYEDINRKLINDIEEDGMNLDYILGPAKAPGQTYKVMDYRTSKMQSKNIDTDTMDNSMTTNALVYYDDDQHIAHQKLIDAKCDLPKKLLKRGGKKGKRTKGIK
jgi:hypothetical protein